MSKIDNIGILILQLQETISILKCCQKLLTDKTGVIFEGPVRKIPDSEILFSVSGNDIGDAVSNLTGALQGLCCAQDKMIEESKGG